jgi:phosphatidylserine/phosphatidylglycerophosphate/cardiolipin synthase-like enzyme
MIVEALIARAQAGVEVRIVLDAIGSSYLNNSAARTTRGARLPRGVLSADHLVGCTD